MAPKTKARTVRSRRVRTASFEPGAFRARLAHRAQGPLKASVEDLSVHGVCLHVVAQDDADGLLLTGDRIDSFALSYGSTELYNGVCVVRYVDTLEGALRVGVEVPELIDLPSLYRDSARADFSARWAEANDASEMNAISDEFKSAVVDIRAYLEKTKRLLDQEDAALAKEDRLTRDQLTSEYIDQALPGFVAAMAEFAQILFRALTEIPSTYHPAFRTFCQSNLLRLFMASPLMQRAYGKPLSHPGDFEVMNMFYRDHAEGETLFGKLVNLYLCQEAATRANINRLDYLDGVLRRAIHASIEPVVHIASIGCGPAREIGSLLERSPELGRRLDVTLLDQEEKAIRYCEKTLTPFVKSTGVRIHFVQESVRRLLATRRLPHVLRQSELVYSAGLFDYLHDRTFSVLAQILYDSVRPDGTLVIGNVSPQNPSRGVMEFLLEWFLIHRTSDELRTLIADLSPAPSSIVIESEPLGLNGFLRIGR